MDLSTTVIVLLLFLLGIIWYNQQKFKGKVLCVFHTQQNTRVEKWVPMEARHVAFGNKKKGDEGIYFVAPDCFSTTFWDRGLNKLWPVIVSTVEFMWYCPFPINFKAIQRFDPQRGRILPAVSWHTPEVRNAAWQEHGYRGFTRQADIQIGKKPSAIERYLPLVAFGLGLFALLLIWRAGLIM